MTPTQSTYFNLISQSNFSIASLLDYCRKTGRPVAFRELWGLLTHLDQNGQLLQPRLGDWQSSHLDQKLKMISYLHIGNHEKASALELKQFPFFRNLRPELLELFSNQSSIHNVDSGLYLCRQGGSDRTLFIILEGQVNIYNTHSSGERLLLARAENGSILGEAGFFLGAPRTADLLVVNPGKVIQIHFNDQFEALINTENAKRLRDRFHLLTALLKNPLFLNLNDFAFDALFNSGKMIQLKENEILFRQGDLGDCFYVFIQGALIVTQNEKKINVPRPGEALGEIAFLKPDQKRTATVSAQAPSLLMQIPYSQLIDLVFNNIGLGVMIEHLAIEKLERDKKRNAST